MRKRFKPLIITAQHEKALRERTYRIRELGRMLSAMQRKAIDGGLDMDERSLAGKYEKELGEWLEEDVVPWFVVNPNGGMEYRRTKILFELAKALRNGSYWGRPVI